MNKNTQHPQRVALVTGDSSGLGLCVARALAIAGCRVYGLSRRDFKCTEFTHISADVSDRAAVDAAVSRIASEAGGIDIAVNCAGFGISGAAEFTSPDEAERLMRVNLHGAANVCCAVIPYMRAAKGGRIVNISSVAAPIAIPFQAWYSASKAALCAYSAALSGEVAPFGISVCSILPGDTKTGFTAAREKSAQGAEVYGGRIARSVEGMERDEQNGMGAELSGKKISRICLKKRVKPTYVIGFKYKLFVMLSRLLPEALVRKIVDSLYAK